MMAEPLIITREEPMKKGQDVRDMLNKINDDVKHKKDYIVQLSNLKTETSMNTFPDLSFGKENIQFLNLTDHSVSQLCAKLNIGSSYIKKCMPWQELAITNLNHWIGETKDRDLMIRSYENQCRAILSDRYKRIDNDVIATKGINRLLDMGFEIKYNYYDTDTLNITAVLPKLEGEIEKDDIVQGGVTITNSEIGGGSFNVKPFIYRLVCTNGMVVPEEIGRFYAKHVGKKIIDVDEDTQDEIVVEKMLDKLNYLKDDKLFENIFEKMRESKKIISSSNDIVQLAKQHNLSDSERAGIFERLGHQYGDHFTYDNYSLANALTNIANDEELSDTRARFFQELGGQIIFYPKANAVR